MIITNETPLTFLTVGQLISVINRSEKKDQTPVKPQIPEIYGVERLQQISGYSRATIYAKTSKNEIPYFKRDGKLIFRHADIIEWLTANRKETKEEAAKKLDETLTNRKGRK